MNRDCGVETEDDEVSYIIEYTNLIVNLFNLVKNTREMAS